MVILPTPTTICLRSLKSTWSSIGMTGETSTAGVLVRTIDIASLTASAPADMVRAPGSLNPAVKHLYIVDRGVDNNADPLANDGKLYEVSLDPLECSLLGENLLLDPGFE